MVPPQASPARIRTTHYRYHPRKIAGCTRSSVEYIDPAGRSAVRGCGRSDPVEPRSTEHAPTSADVGREPSVFASQRITLVAACSRHRVVSRRDAARRRRARNFDLVGTRTGHTDRSRVSDGCTDAVRGGSPQLGLRPVVSRRAGARGSDILGKFGAGARPGTRRGRCTDATADVDLADAEQVRPDGLLIHDGKLRLGCRYRGGAER